MLSIPMCLALWSWHMIQLHTKVKVKQGSQSCTKLGSQVKVRCSVVTSWETSKFVLQLMFYLNLLFQNTWSYINWWLYILWHPRIDHSHVLLIVMHELGCFELVYFKSLMKSQSYETRSSMKLTVGGNIYDQSTRNWQY